MIFNHTKFAGVYIVELDKMFDERGFFARTWCAKEFEEHGLNPKLVQCNLSYNIRKGTLRGMHYQVAPFAEAKVVSCLSGAIYDVILDLRAESPTFGQWQAFELASSGHRMLYIPEGFAHGFQTLVDDTSVFYQMSEFFHPECARGIRWDDPVFNIQWPISTIVISPKDTNY